MSNYYSERKRAFRRLSQMLETAKKNGSVININILLLNLTEIFEIGENTIMKRLRLMEKAQEEFKIKNEEIVFITES